MRQVLYELASHQVAMSCWSKETVNITASSCLSHFASNVAGGFCEFCCFKENGCNK